MRAFLAVLLLALLAACRSASTPAQSNNTMALPPTLVFTMGQSNGIGPDSSDPPALLPDATIPFLQRDYHYYGVGDELNTWGSLQVSTHGASHAHTLKFAKRLKAAGFPTAAASLCQGATFINRWPPGASASAPGGKVYTDIATNVKPHLDTLYPGGWGYIWVWDQGESEARYNDLPTVQAWSDYYALIKAGVTSAMGKAPAVSFVLRTCSTITGKTFPGVLEAEQQGVTDSVTSFWVDTNDGTYEPDGVHRTGIFQNTLGDRMADIAIPMLIPPSPPNSISIKATIFDPTLLGIRMQMGAPQVQQWPARARGSIYHAHAPGMRLDMSSLVATNTPSAPVFRQAQGDRVAVPQQRIRTGVPKPRSN